MKSLRLEHLWQLLPAVEELRPVLDLLLERSVPDPERTWTGSGELDTVGERLAAPETLRRDADELAREVARHLAVLYDHLARGVEALASDDPGGAAAAFLEAARVEEERDRPERAEAWARTAFQLARGERDQGPAALALRRWGRAARTQGRLEEALLRYREGFEVAEALRDPRGAAEAAVGAGNVLEEQGRFPQAEEWYRRALQLLEPVPGNPPERWHAQVNLHIVLRSQGRLEESRAYLDAAHEGAGDDRAATPFLENARGQLRQVEGDFAAAESHFRRALEAAGGPGARIVVGLNLAENLLGQGRHLDAAEAARGAELEAIHAALTPRLPEVYRLLGRIASDAGNTDAFVLFERALEIIRDRGLPPVEEARTLQAYAEAERQHGDPDAARQLHDRAVDLYRTVGIRHPRHPWSEYFGPTEEPPDSTDSHANQD